MTDREVVFIVMGALAGGYLVGVCFAFRHHMWYEKPRADMQRAENAVDALTWAVMWPLFVFLQLALWIADQIPRYEITFQSPFKIKWL